MTINKKRKSSKKKRISGGVLITKTTSRQSSSHIATPQQVKNVVRVIKILVRDIEHTNSSYEDLEIFLDLLGKTEYGRDILLKLANKKNGLDDFVRTLIKTNHLTEAQYKAIDANKKHFPGGISEYGGGVTT